MEPVLTLGAVSAPIIVLLIIIGSIVAIPLGVVAIIYLIVPLFKGIGWFFKQIGVFIFSTVADTLRFIGAGITSLVLVPLTIGNLVIGRWSATAHYGRAIQAEIKNGARCVYRLLIGNPARLLCLTPLTDGLERRIPEVMAAAPGSDRPSRRLGQFPGYEVVGSLPGGGSGGRLYIAKPDAQKLAAFARNGHAGVDRVVIKCFSQQDGTTLPQIVRENRALDAAKKLGLILEHDITNERFCYVMRYVPGDSLNLVSQRLHAAAGGNGLGRRELSEVLSYTADLLRTLRTYHEGGLWHKDVKPDNVIVAGGAAHLVDFGLVTPLRSSMTLTTHGTEYFRDPEMVRMALKGVKVHEVDGAKFDLYAVGAVLYSMIENSFPAHGGLSQISRPCPEAARWIVRRAMTDYDKRYASAGAMLADIEAVLRSTDPFAVRPAQLPSMAQADEVPVPPPAPHVDPYGAPVAAAPHAPAYATPANAPYPGAQNANGWNAYPGMNPNVAAPAAPHTAVGGRVKPDLMITDWFSGRYAVKGATVRPGAPAVAVAAAAAAAVGAAGFASSPRRAPRVPAAARASAADQLKHARTRAAAARQRARARSHGRSHSFPTGINTGVAVAVFVFLALFGAAMMAIFFARSSQRIVAHMPPSPMPHGVETLPVVVAGAPSSTTTVSTPISDAGGARVLVVCEWSKFDEQRQALIAGQIENLADAGFLLMGDFIPGQEPGNDNAEAVALLRTAIGTRPFLSTAAIEAAQTWLDEEGHADMVVWFAGSAPGKPQIPATAWIIGSSQTTPEVIAEAQGQLAVLME